MNPLVVLSSPATILVTRLVPGQDLRKALQQIARDHDLRGAIVVTCVGSLKEYHLRFANNAQGTGGQGHFEILSLAGTVSTHGVHLHLCIADGKGATLGGHLLDGNIIYTTAEIALATLPDVIFKREPDKQTGFSELVITRRR